MLKLQQLIGAQGQRSVRPAPVVVELNFVHTRGKSLDDRTDLAPPKVLAGNIFEQRNHREQFEFAHSRPQSNSTKQLVSRGADSPRSRIQALRILASRSPRASLKSTL